MPSVYRIICDNHADIFQSSDGNGLSSPNSNEMIQHLTDFSDGHGGQWGEIGKKQETLYT